ncbi:FxsA family protein [Bartonella senegalensis]|uniref:FxsA family protein n=1 Tax=Bartonella senegalensis TaxID=1468418 RepID=UPI0002FCDA75|nr:FxsA family protein [Bartonella senegalensis]
MIKYYRINSRFFILLSLGALLVEIAGFIFVGKEIGILATLGLVILTTIVGSILFRIQGGSLLKNIQSEFLQGRTLENYFINDGFIIIGAILLILPGFVSDILGILLLLKPFRAVAWSLFLSLKDKMNTHPKNTSQTKNKSEKIIDLKAEDYKVYDSTESSRRKNEDHH